jgi:Transglutaminase-like superfamily
LRQALALYAVLSRLSYPATIHVGVAKDGGVLHGHSWITVRGQPVGEQGAVEAFQILYAVGPTSGDEGSRHIQGSREAM